MRCLRQSVVIAAWHLFALLALPLSLFCVAPPPAAALTRDFDITRIEYGSKVRSGSESISGGLSGFGNMGGFPQKWGIVTVHYNSRPAWADDVMLKYYVLVRDAKGKPAMFTGNVSYVSVHEGLDHAGLMFIHPNSLARYGAVKRIAVEIWHGGVLADSAEWPGKSAGRWWNKVAPVQGTLRTRFYTPFEHDYEVREEDIKLILPS